uniref:40S ribosomal protein S20-2-like n=1 Tax=Rhizophora mucronata TaxID=61149 RepID=A0A2P2JVV5_RHIMU
MGTRKEAQNIHESAIVTSTSTPGSIVMEVICLTMSGELKRSITRLWTRSSNLSHVLVPVNSTNH